MRHLLLLVPLAACSPRADAIGERPAPAPASEPARALSTLGETCAATADCIAPLHCVEAACRSLQRSRLGDLHWGQARAAKEPRAAVDAYGVALAQYAEDKVDVPADLACDAGAAFARLDDDTSAEQAARLLHDCTLRVPAGSSRYLAAMTELGRLLPRGLEPRQVAAETTGATYLTADKPKVDMTPRINTLAPANDKGFVSFEHSLPALNEQLAACAKDGPGTPPVTLDLKLKVRTGDDDLVVGAKLEVILSGAPTPTGECVREVIARAGEAWVKDRKNLAGSWTASVEVAFPAK